MEEELREAREILYSAKNILSGLVTLLGPETKSTLKEDIHAVRGALILVQESVLQVSAIIRELELTQEIDGENG